MSGREFLCGFGFMRFLVLFAFMCFFGLLSCNGWSAGTLNTSRLF